MTSKTNKAINARQVCFLLFAILTIYKLINVPQALDENAGRDGWWGSVILMAWEGILLIGFVLITVKFPGRTAEDLLGKVFGKVMMRIILALFAIFLTVKFYLGIVTTQQFLTANLFSRVSWLPFGIPMILVTCYSAVKGIRSIGRVAEILGILLVACLVTCTVAMMTQADFEILLPFFHEGAANMLKATDSVLMGTGECIVFIMLLGRVERAKIARYTGLGFGMASLVVIGFNLCFFGFYGEAGVHMKYGRAILDMLQYLRGSDSLARLDIFIVLAMLLLSLLKLMTYAWGICMCLTVVFGLKENTHKSRIIALVPAFTLILVLSYLLEKDIFNIYNFIRGPWKFALLVPTNIILPILIMVGAVVERVRARKLQRRAPIYHRRKT